jgi:hypothetical protein
MNIADILNNLPEQNKNTLANKIQKNSEVRRIKSRIDNYISQILDFLGEESKYISNSLSYSENPMYGEKLTEEEKKELTNVLVSEVKSLPEKLKTEINKFFEEISSSENNSEDKKEDSEVGTVTTVSFGPEKSAFSY